MWEGDRSLANGRVADAMRRGSTNGAPTLRVAGGAALRRANPVPADAIALARGMSARQAFDAVLATYAAAIAENLRCVLSESDPEGAHQLRVALRRLRTYLRVFKPVIRRAAAKHIGWMARYIGAIVGELRDADVIIEDMLRPAAQSDAAVLRAVETWREEIRFKVRSSLRAARATAFADELSLLAANGGWRSKAKRSGDGSAAALINAAIGSAWEQAADCGSRMLTLTSLERHDLRKDLKALRYTVELSTGFEPDSAALAGALKRLQTILGQLNDMQLLEAFDPGVGIEREALTTLQRRVSEDHARSAPALVANANARWLELVSSGRLRTGVAVGA
jgi:CHAD domain-containing protein